MDARIQLFDLKTTYRFQTSPGIQQYNMPLYNVNGYPNSVNYPQVEPGNQLISYYPVYQGFLAPAFVNGIQVPFYTERGGFFNIWPQYTQSLNNTFLGDGGATYSLTLPDFPALVGHVDYAGIIAAASATNSNTFSDPIVSDTVNLNVPLTSIFSMVFINTQDANNNPVRVFDSGQFFNVMPANSGNIQLGMLQGNVTGGYSTTSNVVNYSTGAVNVTFSTNIPANTPINVQCYFIESGIPRAILYYNNCIWVMPPPDVQYLIEMDAYLTPAAFLSTSQALPFAYMAEYIARGAARKILADTGDIEQFNMYEPLFKEQETLVWKRSQRQFTANRTPTIFSEFSSQSPSNNFSGGGN